MPAGISATAINALNSTTAAATMLAVTTGRQRLRPRMPKANSAAPGTNATHHSSQAVACRLLASLCRSSGSSGSTPSPTNPIADSSSNCVPTRAGQPASAGRRCRRSSAATAANTPVSTKPNRLNPSARGTPFAPSTATGCQLCE